MEIDVVRVARKTQVVDAVHFEKKTQMWDIAQWMKAHQIDGDLNGCLFVYTFLGETRELNVKLNKWIVLDESGFSSYNELDFQKKFTIER
jgi:hypothetical protein